MSHTTMIPLVASLMYFWLGLRWMCVFLPYRISVEKERNSSMLPKFSLIIYCIQARRAIILWFTFTYVQKIFEWLCTFLCFKGSISIDLCTCDVAYNCNSQIKTD